MKWTCTACTCRQFVLSSDDEAVCVISNSNRETHSATWVCHTVPLPTASCAPTPTILLLPKDRNECICHEVEGLLSSPTGYSCIWSPLIHQPIPLSPPLLLHCHNGQLHSGKSQVGQEQGIGGYLTGLRTQVMVDAVNDVLEDLRINTQLAMKLVNIAIKGPLL